MFHPEPPNEPVTVDTGVEADTTETVTYEVANMAEEENTFHLTYEDGKAVSFQVYDDGTGERTPAERSEVENKTWLREMLRRPKSTIATICKDTEQVGKENEAQGIDEDNELWELYMKAQYSGYKEREIEQDDISSESDISDQGNI